MASPPTVPLTVDATQAGLSANTPVSMYVVGLVSAATDTYYRLDSTGTPQVMSEADSTNAAGTFPGSGALPAGAATALAANYPLAWADYGIPVSLTETTVIDLSSINTTNCPGLGTGTAAFSGRVYVAIGAAPLPFTPQDNGYTAPVPSGGPGALSLFDWIEFSYDSEGNFNGNTTQVDQFGFELHLDGTPGGTLQGVLNQSRSDIMDAFGNALASPFGQGVLQVAVPAGAGAAYPSGTNVLRVISPKTITAPAAYTGPLDTYFDDVIAQWYTTWQTTPIVTNDQATGYYSGMVVDGVLTFKQGNYATADAWNAAPASVETFAVAPGGVIPTADVWQCANSLATGNTEQKNVQKMLAAAFNRGVMGNLLDDTTCGGSASSFYPSGGTFNVWSQMFHGFSQNGLAYGFPYDDVCNQNPSISLAGTQSVTITLGPFGTAAT
ncbi:beta-1,3-glucanase family protein [Longimicrobium sp.]|uniref:beta-1,3-glucanase family protein n=1 Tax=Longimicrobium sp. TaxID=2029185 RepID=UPI002E326498|nr:beta-1,3-glucanase family protein [Longimicrobium sp.]HEX6039201.1 beta-1,3-glucanase family protein [Longimicrobium sp.]